MKVTFVQPYYENVWESIGIGYIIGYARDHYKGDLEINFFQGNFDDDDTIIEDAVTSDIAAFSCTTPCFAHAKRLAEKIKERNPNVRTVFGGWHITALKDKLLEHPIDQIVLGEGEKAFLTILEGETAPIVYGVKVGFEELSWPDRETIKNERTVALCESMNGQRTTSFQANRVCPVACVFCAEHIMTGKAHKTRNPVRSRDPKDVCDEIEHTIEKYGLTYFKFVDATFDVTAQYVIDFCKEKIRRGITTEWEALIHATFASEEMFEWLKKSNCNQINIGVESGSPKVLKAIRKGTNLTVLRRVFDWGKKYGIQRRAFFILGMPNETEEDLRLTEDLIEEIQPDVLGFTILCPYPGCDLYDHERFKDVDWEGTDEYENDIWYTDHFTNFQLKQWQAYFKDKYGLILCEREVDVEILEGYSNGTEKITSHSDLFWNNQLVKLKDLETQ